MTAPRRARPDARAANRSAAVSDAPDALKGGFPIRNVTAYAVVLALGMAMLAGHRPGADATGRVTMLTGAGGCAWELGRWLREKVQRRSARASELARVRARGELKAFRAARRSGQRDTRQQNKQETRRAIYEREQAQRATRRAQQERQAQERAQRAANFEDVSREAERLQALPEAAWIAEVIGVFAERGLRLQTGDSRDTPPAVPNAGLEGVCELYFLRVADAGADVAHSLPPGRAGVVADIETLEQRRRQTGAQQMYLLGRDGFSVAAIRLAPRLPLTLVEPNLLAQWKIAGRNMPGASPAR